MAADMVGHSGGGYGLGGSSGNLCRSMAGRRPHSFGLVRLRSFARGVGIGANDAFRYANLRLSRVRDRPWQAYPVTIITGAYIGYALGCSAGRTPFFYGKSVHFDSDADTEQSQQASSGKQ
jgi:phosphatidylinositol glycan class F